MVSVLSVGFLLLTSSLGGLFLLLLGRAAEGGLFGIASRSERETVFSKVVADSVMACSASLACF